MAMADKTASPGNLTASRSSLPPSMDTAPAEEKEAASTSSVVAVEGREFAPRRPPEAVTSDQPQRSWDERAEVLEDTDNSQNRPTAK